MQTRKKGFWNSGLRMRDEGEEREWVEGFWVRGLRGCWCEGGWCFGRSGFIVYMEGGLGKGTVGALYQSEGQPPHNSLSGVLGLGFRFLGLGLRVERKIAFVTRSSVRNTL